MTNKRHQRKIETFIKSIIFCRTFSRNYLSFQLGWMKDNGLFHLFSLFCFLKKLLCLNNLFIFPMSFAIIDSSNDLKLHSPILILFLKNFLFSKKEIMSLNIQKKLFQTSHSNKFQSIILSYKQNFYIYKIYNFLFFPHKNVKKTLIGLLINKYKKFMRQHDSTLNLQYRLRIKTILDNYPLMHYSNQFVEILNKYNIKFFSKEDVQRIHKLADPKSKRLRLDTAIGYLELACVQTFHTIKYFVVKARLKPSKTQSYLMHSNYQHDVCQCIEMFKNLMRRLYGSELNWFKAIGGITISVKVDRDICVRNLSRILRNTCHSECGEKITSYFLKNGNSKEVQWRNFMKIMREGKQSKHSKSLSFTGCSIKSPQQRSLSRALENTSFSVETDIFLPQNPLKQLALPLESKKCKLYKRAKTISPFDKKLSIQQRRRKSLIDNMEMFRTTNTQEEKRSNRISERPKTIL